MPKFRFKLKITKLMNSNTHIRVLILKWKLRDWTYPNYTEKKVFLWLNLSQITRVDTIQYNTNFNWHSLKRGLFSDNDNH